MPRVTVEQVKAIFPTSLVDGEIAAHIDTAHVVVDRRLKGRRGMTEPQLVQVERWLAAHFACMADPRTTSEKIGDGSVTHEGQSGLGLDHTRYGQQAKLLADGLLTDLDKRPFRLEAL